MRSRKTDAVSALNSVNDCRRKETVAIAPPTEAGSAKRRSK